MMMMIIQKKKKKKEKNVRFSGFLVSLFWSALQVFHQGPVSLSLFVSVLTIYLRGAIRYSMCLPFANNTEKFHAVISPNNSSRPQSIVYDVDAPTIS